jgi:tol-pal system protein YbgF
MVRVDRLENQIRTLNGQLEQMQFQIHKLEEQLRKQQQDIDFRFDELKPKAGGKPAPANAPAPAPQRRSEADTTAPLVASVDQTARPARRADVFDPSANPEAPGAPRDLGALPPGANAAPPPRASNLPTGPLADGSEVDPNAPINLAPRGTAALVPQASEAAPRAGDLQTGSLPQAAPVDHYETGMAAFKNGQFEVAEQNLRSYLDAHPKERLSPEAIFFLGESYFRRARVRDAAEQYLKVSTDFPRAPRAPESLVRLGLALEKLGAKEQACAAFGEVQRKYPAAPAPVRQSADRELKRVQC